MLPVRLRLHPTTSRSSMLFTSSFRTSHFKMDFAPPVAAVDNQWLIVVPKSVVKLATSRNRIKRVLREAIRKTHKNFPSGRYKLRLLKNLNEPQGPRVEEELIVLLSKIKTSQGHAQ